MDEQDYNDLIEDDELLEDYQNAWADALKEKEPLHVVKYSGGVSSALVAAMVLKKYGKENTVWVNSVVNAEPEDVSRFEEEFAKYHDMEITYLKADEEKYPGLTPYSVAKKEKAFAIRGGFGANILCTSRLKIDPFMEWLKSVDREVRIYYGFDKGEEHRLQRVSTESAVRGIRGDAPLITWDNPLTPRYLDEIGVKPPMQYQTFKHANCIGCLKAHSKRHWLCVYVHHRAIFDQFKELENELGYSIIRNHFLEELEPYFEEIQKLGLEINEHGSNQKFWAEIKRALRSKNSLDFASEAEKEVEPTLPCGCVV